MTPGDLRAIRVGLGWTQQRLAEAMRVQRLAVVRWESGTRRISPSHIELLRRIAAENR